MKKSILFLVLALGIVFQYCSSPKKVQAAAAPPVAKVTYASNVQPVIQSNCSPCHIPPQGRAKPLNTYDAAKANADDIIARIGRNPEDKGFMPMRHPKLADSTISVFVKWKESGLMEN